MIALILLATGLIRWRLAEIPLERDEGEYAYVGQLMLQGIPPYLSAYNMKLPGTYASYALLMALFGETTEGIHLGLILVNGLTILLVFLLGRRLVDPRAGVAAAAAFTLLAMSQGVYGMAAHATHFVALFGTAGFLMLLYAVDTDRLRWLIPSGVLFGLAFLMKQHGVFFILLGVTLLAASEWRRAPRSPRLSLFRLVLFGASAVSPFIITCGILAWAGVFDRFWFWTFTYAREYLRQTPLPYAWEAFSGNITEVIGPNLLLWLLAGFGLISAWWEPQRRRSAKWVTSFLAFAFLAVCPGLYFRHHYFIVLLPAVALGVGAALSWTRAALAQRPSTSNGASVLAMLLLLTALGTSLWWQREYLFEFTPEEACRSTYPLNPFLESPAIGQYLKQHTTPDDRIAVVGSEPQIYFYSERLSATGYLYMYGLMEEHPFASTMQREMITEIEGVQPKFLVWVNIPFSWQLRPRSEMLIWNWANSYIRRHYEQTGVIELDGLRATIRWDDKAKNHQPRSPFHIVVYQRMDAAVKSK